MATPNTKSFHERILVCIAIAALLPCLPLVLLNLAIGLVRDRIETRWPNNTAAAAVGFWFGLLAPVLLIIVLVASLVIKIRDSF